MEPTEQIETAMEAAVSVNESETQVQALATAEPLTTAQSEIQISDIERERWIWTFEKLKSAEIGMSLSEKVKLFCEATTPDEVERFIQAQLDDQNIIPLAA